MKLLLDTHILVWSVTQSPRLSPQSLALLNDSSNRLTYSVVSIWEIAIKNARAKHASERLPMTALAMLDHLATLDIELIPIDGHHAAAVETLPLHHRDPFDRLLVAQAKVETAVLLTQDGALAIYGDFVLLV